MKIARREFFKKLGSSAFLLSFSGASPAKASEGEVDIATTEAVNSDHVDRSLLFLKRESGSTPTGQHGYWSSFYQKTFRLEKFDPQNARAYFYVSNVDQVVKPDEALIEFSVKQNPQRITFFSLDKKYAFFWKPQFGFYALDNKNPSRIVEHCESVEAAVPYLSDLSITVPMDSRGNFYSRWVRWSYWVNGGPHSPLPGFEGFAEESLYLDASVDRDSKVAAGLNWFANSVSFGLPAIKLMAKTNPKLAVKFLEALIPRVFGWMIGPTKRLQPGKLELSNCPYRKRLGTRVCESTCGHSIGRYFTKNVGIPMRFDPTVDGYKKCHILIGSEQYGQKDSATR